jgi:hypothetical protein
MAKKKTSIDDLARMIKTGFDGVDERLEKLEIGQEDIKLRLDQAAWKFELEELKTRVENIESKIGM